MYTAAFASEATPRDLIRTLRRNIEVLLGPSSTLSVTYERSFEKICTKYGGADVWIDDACPVYVYGELLCCCVV